MLMSMTRTCRRPCSHHSVPCACRATADRPRPSESSTWPRSCPETSGQSSQGSEANLVHVLRLLPKRPPEVTLHLLGQPARGAAAVHVDLATGGCRLSHRVHAAL